jgi:plastocyanin
MKRTSFFQKSMAFTGIVVSSLLLTACTSTQTPAPTTKPLPETSTATSSADSNEQIIKISAKDFQFSQPEIRVKQNQKVKIVVTNEGGFHDFIIDELRVNTGIIPAGGSKEVTIRTDIPGEYAYYCSVSNHRSRGMQGKLIIEEVAQ